MNQKMDSIFQRIHACIKSIQNDGLIQRLNHAEEFYRSPDNKILIVGERVSGRKSTANFLLGQQDQLPTFLMLFYDPKIYVQYGQSEYATVIQKDGMQNTVQLSKIREYLQTTENDSVESIVINLDHPWLKHCPIQIEELDGNKGVEYWKNILSETSFVLVVLNATHLLSQNERTFFKEALLPFFPISQIGFVINKMDQLRQEERESVKQYLDQYLGSISATPLILCTSQNHEDETGMNSFDNQSLYEFIHTDLINAQKTFKRENVDHTLNIILEDIKQETRNKICFLQMSTDDIQTLMDERADKKVWLSGRIENTLTRVELFIDTLFKEKVNREIENFGNCIRENISEEILSIKDINTIKRLLPAYLEKLWGEFFEIFLPIAQHELQEEINTVDSIIQKDIAEYNQEIIHKINEVNKNFIIGQGITPYIPSTKQTNKANTAATILQVAGFGVALFTGSILLGGAAFGAGHIVRRFAKTSMENEELTAITTQAISISYDLENQVKAILQNNFSRFSTQLQTSIKEIYQQSTSQIEDELEIALKDIQEKSATITVYQNILDHEINDIQSDIESLFLPTPMQE